MGKQLGFAALGAALVLNGCAAKAPPPPPKPKVSAAYPIQRTVTDWDDYVGRFQAIQDVQVIPRVSGNIKRIAFQEGRTVKKGDLLFVIDPAPYAAALAQARADAQRAAASLANADTEFARAKSLLGQQAISQEEYETKLAAVRTDTAALASARANVRAKALDLGYTTVRAPITGRVSDKRVSLGDYVTPGQTLLTRIVKVDPIWFTFDGAESFYLKYIREAQRGTRQSSRYAPNPVDIQLADESSHHWHGRMVFVDNAIDPNAGTIRAHAEIANPNGFLVPGMFGRARLIGSGAYPAVLIPDEAILTDQTRRTVFVIGKDGRTEQRNVQTGPLVQGLRVVRTGVGAGDRVVLDGLARLQPGTPVDVKAVKISPRAADDSPSTPVEAPPPASATVR